MAIVRSPVCVIGVKQAGPMPSAPPAPDEQKLPAPTVAPVTSADDIRSRFQALVKSKELNSVVADKLFQSLSGCEVVLLCDDSDSMNQAIAEEGTDVCCFVCLAKFDDLCFVCGFDFKHSPIYLSVIRLIGY